MTDQDTGGGINGAELQDREDLGGAGGSSGGGTIAGSGDPSGGTLGGTVGGGIAGEAAALGDADGSLADAASATEPGAERLSVGPTGGETFGAGAGRGEVGSGTPGDKGDLGGGDS